MASLLENLYLAPEAVEEAFLSSSSHFSRNPSETWSLSKVANGFEYTYETNLCPTRKAMHVGKDPALYAHTASMHTLQA